MVLLYTGLRAGDAANLTWDQIDLEEGWIRLTTEKTEEQLMIPINSKLREYLLDYGTEGNNLFPGIEREPLRKKVRRYLKKILREAGIETAGVGLHAFRHTFASHLVMAGVPLAKVQKLLGHKSIIMTQVYAHLSPESTREEVEALDFGSPRLYPYSSRRVLDGAKALIYKAPKVPEAGLEPARPYGQ